MKYLIILAAVFVAIQKAPAQQQIKIKEYAQQCANAFTTGDYALLVKFTYPKLIAAIGGKEHFIKVVTGQMAQMKANGVVFKKAAIGTPGQIYIAGTELHCLVPETLTLKTNDGYLVATSYLLAVSSDKGRSWYFVDMANSTPAKLKQLFPNFNSKLIIPVPTQPVFSKDSV